jgi:hypothetical protein
VVFRPCALGVVGGYYLLLPMRDAAIGGKTRDV